MRSNTVEGIDGGGERRIGYCVCFLWESEVFGGFWRGGGSTEYHMEKIINSPSWEIDFDVPRTIARASSLYWKRYSQVTKIMFSKLSIEF